MSRQEQADYAAGHDCMELKLWNTIHASGIRHALALASYELTAMGKKTPYQSGVEHACSDFIDRHTRPISQEVR